MHRHSLFIELCVKSRYEGSKVHADKEKWLGLVTGVGEESVKVIHHSMLWCRSVCGDGGVHGGNGGGDGSVCVHGGVCTIKQTDTFSKSYSQPFNCRGLCSISV